MLLYKMFIFGESLLAFAAEYLFVLGRVGCSRTVSSSTMQPCTQCERKPAAAEKRPLPLEPLANILA